MAYFIERVCCYLILVHQLQNELPPKPLSMQQLIGYLLRFY